jgi:hypothetical protein
VKRRRLTEAERLADPVDSKWQNVLTEKQKREIRMNIIRQWFQGEAFQQYIDGEVSQI